jgi:hypothetical protein
MNPISTAREGARERRRRRRGSRMSTIPNATTAAARPAPLLFVVIFSRPSAETQANRAFPAPAPCYFLVVYNGRGCGVHPSGETRN